MQVLHIARQLAQEPIDEQATLRKIGWPETAPEIIFAHYGGVDITTLAKMLFERSESIVVDTSGYIPIQDPWPGVHKALSCVYRFDAFDENICVLVGRGDLGRSWTLSVPETKLNQNDAEMSRSPSIPPPAGCAVHIRAVFHGQRHVTDEDVYRKLYLCAQDDIEVVVSKHFFNGTGANDELHWPGEPKSAAVVYTVNGVWKSMCGKEGEILRWQL